MLFVLLVLLQQFSVCFRVSVQWIKLAITGSLTHSALYSISSYRDMKAQTQMHTETNSQQQTHTHRQRQRHTYKLGRPQHLATLYVVIQLACKSKVNDLEPLVVDEHQVLRLHRQQTTSVGRSVIQTTTMSWNGSIITSADCQTLTSPTVYRVRADCCVSVWRPVN